MDEAVDEKTPATVPDRSVDGFGRPNRPPVSDAESELVPATTTFDPPAKPESRVPIVDSSPRWRASFATFGLLALTLASTVLAVVGSLQGSVLLLAISIAGFVIGGVFNALVFSKGRAAVTVRKAVVRLPVLRDPEVQRLGALAGMAATTCGRCSAFDLSIGQQQLVRFGDFARAAAFLTPETMMKTKRGSGPWTPDAGFDDRGQPVDEGGPSWNTMGGCRKHGQLVFAPHSCKDWS